MGQMLMLLLLREMGGKLEFGLLGKVGRVGTVRYYKL